MLKLIYSWFGASTDIYNEFGVVITLHQTIRKE
jgi:hypothetical protein